MFEFKRLTLNDREKEDFLGLLSGSLATNTMDWLEWKYLKNPVIHDKPTVFGTFHKASGKLIGIRPFLACNVVLNGRIFKAAQPGDTVVHPDFRGQGLFSQMNRIAIEELGKEGYDLFFNFPNRNSQPGYLKMGWKIVLKFDESIAFSDFSRVVKDTTNNSIYKFLAKLMFISMSNLAKITEKLINDTQLNSYKVNVNIEDKYDDSIENLWLSKVNNRFRVRRDEKYLNWRFKERPDKAYEYWTIRRKGDLLAYVITTTSDRWGSKECQIVDFNFTEQDYFFIILKEVLKSFSKTCNFVSILACTESDIFRRLNKLGFMHRFQFPYSLAMPDRNFLVRVVNPELLEYDLYDGAMWSLRSGDQDTY